MRDPLPQLATEFHTFFRRHELPAPRPDLLRSLSLDQAYAVQRSVIERRIAEGETPAGYKIGCTSRAIQEQFGLDEPIHARLMKPHVLPNQTKLCAADFYGCAVEPEFVLRIATDITADVLRDSWDHAVDAVAPGIEVHNYHFCHGVPTLQELIASNGIHAAVVVGDFIPLDRGLDLDLEGAGIYRNGRLAASGIGAEIQGGPLASLRWLAQKLLAAGEFLRAGEIVIPGSPVALVRVDPGDYVEAKFTRLGSAAALF